MRKNEFSSRRKWIENYYNKTLLRVQFTLEFYVHRWNYKKNKIYDPFLWTGLCHYWAVDYKFKLYGVMK